MSLQRAGLVRLRSGCGAMLLLAAFAAPPSDVRGAAASGKAPQLSFDHYYDQDAVTAALHELHGAYPELTDLRSLGRSSEDRDIWLLAINDPRTGPDTGKPAVYVDGAIHGNEIQATEVCLYLAWYLLTKRAELAPVDTLLQRCAFYIVPTVNVDSRARFFSDPGSARIGRTARTPHDDDRDGLVDEDDYDDLDGDGEILVMRRRDPFGEMRSDPEDPRLMTPVKRGEQGEWTVLGLEGFDNDGDGRVNEDPPGYLDMNRNWGFNWQPSYVQAGAGDFPFSEPNVWAIGEFLAAHPNICFAFAFHNYGGLWVRGPGSESLPGYPPEDLKIYDYLGQEGERVVPGYRYIVGYRDMYTTYGDFDEFMYQCHGVYGFVGELWRSAQERYRRPGDFPPETAQEQAPGGTPAARPRVTERERLRFSDRLLQGEAFAQWKTFQHPEYGEIEIGGWRPFTTRMPPPFMLLEMVHRNASFVIWTATQVPRVKLEVTEITALGGDLWRVRARAANSAGLPSLSAQALRRRIHPLDAFTLSGRNVRVLSGGVLEDPFHGEVTPVDARPERVPTHLPAFGERLVQWIVAGGGKIVVGYEGVKTGRVAVESELR